MALSWAVMGTLTSPMPPSSFNPTEVVEQLLPASASNADREGACVDRQALALTRGDDWVVVLVPLAESCPGSSVLPIPLARAVIGTGRGGTGGAGVDWMVAAAWPPRCLRTAARRSAPPARRLRRSAGRGAGRCEARDRARRPTTARTSRSRQIPVVSASWSRSFCL